jgi:esterase/lipase
MDTYFDLNQQTYDWCVRIFDQVKKLLGVRIKLHHEQGQIEQGDIFLFNHFSRMETFIPQYLIFKETGAFCRSIAAAEFFRGDDRFAQLLRDVGAVPNDQPNLMAFLAVDLLKGRKVTIFPEGGMVKDRQVIDDQGNYSIFSRASQSRRKHHTGAGRLAIGLQIFKLAILHYEKRGELNRIDEIADSLELPSADALLDNARRPVRIVPANITFYPLRVSDNLLRRGVDLFYDNLSPRAIEELIIEGNLFFKTTDMDIRLGDPIAPAELWSWWEKLLVDQLSHRVDSITQIFDGEYLRANWRRRTAAKGLRMAIRRLRNRYMEDIYRSVTVNMCHLTSRLILKQLEAGRDYLDIDGLQMTIYLAIKHLQEHRHVHLHQSLCNPAIYRELLHGSFSELVEFLESAAATELIRMHGDNVRLLDKLAADHEFDSVRIENPIEVYANEIEPITEVESAIEAALQESDMLTPKRRAQLEFDDELVAFEWDGHFFNKPRHHEINSRETAVADAAPYLLIPNQPRDIGVLVVHGFLASPAEVRPAADLFEKSGFPVMAVRLKGHGTSPWDLRERSWRDWQASVEVGLEILSAYVARVCIVGFSTGGALGLLLAAEEPHSIAGVAAVGTPIKFRNRNMRFVPLMYGANRIIKWLSKYEGVMPFRTNESEHPHINYRNIPIRGLYELTRLVSHLKDKLGSVRCPVTIVQATEDRVVDPTSATIAHDLIASEDKSIIWIDSKRHGLMNENIGNTNEKLLAFVERIAAFRDAAESGEQTADEGADKQRDEPHA